MLKLMGLLAWLRVREPVRYVSPLPASDALRQLSAALTVLRTAYSRSGGPRLTVQGRVSNPLVRLQARCVSLSGTGSTGEWLGFSGWLVDRVEGGSELVGTIGLDRLGVANVTLGAVAGVLLFIPGLVGAIVSGLDRHWTALVPGIISAIGGLLMAGITAVSSARKARAAWESKEYLEKWLAQVSAG